MFPNKAVIRKLIFILLLLVSVPVVINAQETRPQPTWWFGGAIGGNYNWYNGTAQELNSCWKTASPFHRGSGVGLYGALGVEYRPDPVWGGMLYVGYDDRSGKWDGVTCPRGYPLSLSTTLSYISIEPSLRIVPFSSHHVISPTFSSSFYMFLGPRLGINFAKNIDMAGTFTYKVFIHGADSTLAEQKWSDLRNTVVSAEVGAGYDIPLSSTHDKTQVVLSPFVSFHPYYGQNPRTIENWAVTTLRAGVILKGGHGTVADGAPISMHKVVPAVVEGDVAFSLRAPKTVPVKRRIRESFPLRDYVFFDDESDEIPTRYVVMTKAQADTFKEGQLQEVQPTSFTGRSARQMTVYYNILNIIGDRMKRNPEATIALSGASANGVEHGKARADAVKQYLVNVFGIDSTRITTAGRIKPKIPSEQPGGTKELDLLRIEDNRVDIETESPEMVIQVGGASHYMLKPVQIIAEVEDPLDSHVLFNVVGAKDVLKSWSLELTDEKGRVQKFGPFTRERETIPGNTILDGRSQGVYKVVMVGQTKGGKVITKERSVRLFRREEPASDAVRFSILFDFDQSKTVASYEKFLTDIVAPLIPDSSIVIIHGHTDIIGEEEYNLTLSHERAMDAQSILASALSDAGKHNVSIETFEFGEDLKYAPFGNDSPEERFYNRTVIIDIVPEK